MFDVTRAIDALRSTTRPASSSTSPARRDVRDQSNRSRNSSGLLGRPMFWIAQRWESPDTPEVSDVHSPPWTYRSAVVSTAFAFGHGLPEENFYTS